MTEPTARRVACAAAVDGLDLGGGALDLGRLHLAGDGALPDQVVEAELVGIEILAHLGRRAEEIGRADGLVGFLRVLRLGRVDARLLRQVAFAEFLADRGARARRSPPAPSARRRFACR